MLIPAEPAPRLLIEVRDAVRMASVDWVKDDILAPLWRDGAASPEYAAMLSALATDDADEPWRSLGLALGADAAVALYGAAGSTRPFLLIASMAPLARLELARIALAEGWPREDGVTRAEVDGSPITVHYAARGRLVFASDDDGLVRNAFLGMDRHAGFLAPAAAPGSTLASRAAEQDAGRSVSFYWRAEAGDVLGEISLYHGDWAATVWVPAGPTATDRDAIDAARVAALSAPETSHVAFWHAGLSMRTVRDALADHVGVAWLPGPADLDEPLPLVVTIPGGDAAGGLLPEVAVTAVTPSARAAIDGLVKGGTRLTFDGSAVRVTTADDGATLGVPVGFGLRYPVHMAARPGALTFATTERALAALDTGGAPALGGAAQRRADLFQLVADGPALRGAVVRTLGLVKMAGGGPAPSSAALRLLPILARSARITANGVTTPDGFRVDVQGSVAPPTAPAEAETP